MAASGEVPPEPVFKTDSPVEQSVPYLTLEWGFADDNSDPGRYHFELEMAASADFQDPVLRYRGPDQASFISGLAEGEYFFRVRSLAEENLASAWAEPVHVTIQYDSLAKAFLLFGIGGFVTIATVALVVVGDRRVRRETANP